MAKKVSVVLTLDLEAGNAAMVDLGKMLGPQGVNTMGVKKAYDEATAPMRGDIIPAVITIYEDRSFDLHYKTPPTSSLIRKALGKQSGATRPGREPLGTLTDEQLRQIAERKMPDLEAAGDMEKAKKIIAGSARSMGVRVAA